MTTKQSTSAIPEKKYWAFVSYSSKDKRWGSWLHRRLENYPIPKEFQGKKIFDGAILGKNLKKCFRDRDELSGSSKLAPAILEALRQSRYLIVLCSKNSAKSEWVNKEIEDFKALAPGNANRVLALILDGEPNAILSPSFSDTEECFPPALRAPLEPLAGDLRNDKDGKERGFLKVLAGIAQIGFDDLYNRHQRMQRKKRLFISALALAVIVTLTGLSVYAIKQKDIARANEEKAIKQEVITLETLTNARHQQAITAINSGDYYKAMPYALAYHKLDNQSPASSALLFSLLTHSVPQAPLYEPIQLKQEASIIQSSPDDKLLLTAGNGMPIQLWDLNTGKLTAQHATSVTETPYSTGFTPCGRGVYHQNVSNGNLELWNTNKLSGEPAISIPIFMPGELLPLDHEGTSIIWHNSGKTGLFTESAMNLINPSEATGYRSNVGHSIASGSVEQWRTASQKPFSEFEKFVNYRDKHGAPLTCVKLSPNHKVLASGDKKGTIILWNVTDFSEIKKLRTTGGVSILQFSGDGLTLAAYSDHIKKDDSKRLYQTLAAYDVETGGQIFTKTLAATIESRFTTPNRITNLIVSNNGDKLVTTDRKGTIFVWDPVAAKSNDKYFPQWSRTGMPILAFAFDHTEKMVRACSANGKMRTYDVPSFLRFTSNNYTPFPAANAGWIDRAAKCWIIDSQHTVRVYKSDFIGTSYIKLPHAHNVFDLQFSKDGKSLVTLTTNGGKDTHQVWDTATWMPRHPTVQHPREIQSIQVCTSENHPLAISYLGGGQIKWYGTNAGEHNLSQDFYPVGKLSSQMGAAISKISSDGKQLVSAALDLNFVEALTDIEGMSPYQMQNRIRNSMRSKLLFCTVGSEKPVVSTVLDDTRVTDVAISQDGTKVVAVGSNDTKNQHTATVFINRKKTGTILLMAPPGKISLSPNATKALVHTGNNGGTLIDTVAMNVIAHLPHRNMLHDDDFNIVDDDFAINDDDTSAYVATASSDGTAKIWCANTGKLIGKPLIHPSGHEVKAVTFSPNGKWVATGGSDTRVGNSTGRNKNAVIIWDVKSGKQASITLQPRGEVQKLEFSPNGKWLAAACADGNVYIYEWLADAKSPPTKKLQNLIEALTGRSIDNRGNTTPKGAWAPNLKNSLDALPDGIWKKSMLAPFIESTERKVTPSSRFTVKDDIQRQIECYKVQGMQGQILGRKRILQFLESQSTRQMPEQHGAGE